MKVLTISIAAYNVEKYLDTTLNSLVVPSVLNDLEVLIVDDGSKDNTHLIAERYEQLYPNTFKYVMKDNGGHGSTINKGIELATGKYFKILDGDDYFDSKQLENFISILKAIDNDLIISNFCVVNKKGEKKVDPSIIVNGHNPFEDLIDKKVYEFESKVSTRIFGLSTITVKTSLLKEFNVKITEKCFYVDVEFVIWCIFLSKNYLYLCIPLYMYRKDDNGDNSVNKKNMIKNIAMQEKVSLSLCNLYGLFKSKNPNKKKLKLILERVCISVGATIRTYMLLNESNKNCKLIIEKFDNQIKALSESTYNDLNSDRFIRDVRKGNYMFIPFLRFLYNIYIRKKINNA